MRNRFPSLVINSVIGFCLTITSEVGAQTMYFQTNNYLAGAIDSSFVSRPLLANDGSPLFISAGTLQPDGKILLIVKYPVVVHSDIVRLNADGTPDPAFHPDFISSSTYFPPERPIVQKDGRIFLLMDTDVGGRHLIRLRADGSLETIFDFPVEGVTSEKDGSLLVWSGSDESGSSVLDRIGADGSRDRSFSVTLRGGQAYARVRKVVEQDDGKIIVLGQFTSVNGREKKGLARVDHDGLLDEAFAVPADIANSFASRGYSLAVESDKRIVVKTQIENSPGQFTDVIAILREDGSFEQYILNSDDGVPVTQMQDGKWLFFAGLPPPVLYRLNLDFSYDQDFYCPILPVLETIMLQPDGKILAAGRLGDVNEPAGTWQLFRLLPDANYSFSFQSMTRLATGEVELTFNVPASCYDCNYTLQTSSDLQRWSDLVLNVHPKDDKATVDFVDPATARSTPQFYRVKIVAL